MRRANLGSGLLLGLLIAAFFQIGCSSLKTSPKYTEIQFARSWSRQTVDPKYMGFRMPATVSPILAQDLVIEGNGIDMVMAYKKKTGHQVWKIPLENGLEGAYFEKSSNSLFFGSNNGQFYNVDASTGVVRWNFPLYSESTAPPLAQGNFIFHLAMNGSLYAFEKESGRVLWVKSRPPKDSMTVRGTTPPIFDNGRVYVGYSDGYFISYDAASGTPVWEKKISDSKKFNDVDARPAITDKCILVANFSEALYCLNKSTGDVIWQLSEGGSAQPVVLDGNHVVYSTESAILIVDAASGKVQKKFPIPAEMGVPTAALPYKSWLIFGLSEGPLVMMEKESGRWVDTFATGRGISGAPTLDPETDSVYVVSNQANIYKLFLRKRDRAKEFSWGVVQ